MHACSYHNLILLQMELKVNNSVKYIDIAEGSFLAFVRCDTPEGAQTLAQKSDEERHMTILEGKVVIYLLLSVMCELRFNFL